MPPRASLSLFCVLIACGKSGEAGQSPATSPDASRDAPTTKESGPTIAPEIVEAARAHCRQSLESLLAWRSRCSGAPVEFLRARLDLDYECQFVAEAVDHGRMTFDPSQAAQCLKEIDESQCQLRNPPLDERLHLRPPACQQALRGRVPERGYCRFRHNLTTECEDPDSVCGIYDGRCDGQCTPLPRQDRASCSRFDGCAPGFFCDSSEACSKYSQVGEPCLGVRQFSCAPGTVCEGAMGVQEGKCVMQPPPDPRFWPKAGDPCGMYAGMCGAEYTCIEGRCVAPVKNGEVCRSRAVNFEAGCLEGYCDWDPRAGAPPTAVCVPFKPTGGICGDPLIRIFDPARNECGPYAHCSASPGPYAGQCVSRRCQ